MNKEILSIIESISNEKSLDKKVIFNILEHALEISIKKKIDKNINIKVIFDNKTGEFFVFRLLKIVNNVIDYDKEISIKDNLCKNHNVNEYIKEKIDNLKFNRISSKIAKQIILSKIKKIEKNSLIENFKKLIGKMFFGTIKKIFNNKIILDIGYDFEAVLINKHMFHNENYFLEKKIKIILYDVQYNRYGLQLIVSRSHIAMLVELIKENIFEIDNNLLKIIYISRNPGIRTKIVVNSTNNNNNVFNNILKKNFNKISNELDGEIIDFILWDNDIIKFVENIIFPIKAKYIKLNNNIINVFVKKIDLNIILGKNNTNIKLISKLINNYNININSI